MASQGPLTSWLLSATPQALKRATTHPFLAAAGSGTISKETLSQWLSQDRLYAQSYVVFIGMLLTKIRLPAHSLSTETPSNPTIEQTTVDLLIDALVNIRDELRFFETTAAQYGLDLTAIPPEEGGGGAGPALEGFSTSSAGISTAGSGSCPGSTGAVFSAPNISVASAESGEIDETSAPTQSKQRENLHELCKSQGECQMQAGSEVCHPSASQSKGCSTSATSTWTPDCEPCQPSRSASAGPPEPGPVFFGANRITRAYIDMFMSVGSPGVILIEGMTVLWATEVCYLRAWRYAASYGKKNTQQGKQDADADGGALREKFIPNWSSREFEDFVNRIGNVLDEMAGKMKGVEEAETMRARCLEWWKQVVWLEERFWPPME